MPQADSQEDEDSRGKAMNLSLHHKVHRDHFHGLSVSWIAVKYDLFDRDVLLILSRPVVDMFGLECAE